MLPGSPTTLLEGETRERHRERLRQKQPPAVPNSPSRGARHVSEVILDSPDPGEPLQPKTQRETIPCPSVESCEQIYGLLLFQAMKFWAGCNTAIITEPSN